MTVRIGINGFGRIGRSYLRAALANNADVEVVAVNDLTDARTLATLLEWDSVSGHLDGVAFDGDAIAVQGTRIRVFAQSDPATIAWGDVGADVVIESTGHFTDGVAAAAHLKGGARKVIISAPAKGDVPTFVLGVNDDRLDPDSHDVFSNGSCTTNSLAPLGEGAQRLVRHRVRTDDDGPRLHGRPASPRRAALRPAPGPRGGRVDHPDVVGCGEGDRQGHPRARRASHRRRAARSRPGGLDHRPHRGPPAESPMSRTSTRRSARRPAPSGCGTTCSTPRRRWSRRTSSATLTRRSSTRR